MFEKLFQLKQNNTNVKTEVLAGITTFMTMAYILAVNPNIMADAGMDKQGVLIATALASFAGCLFMALFSNYPFALAPGMGLNAYFAYTVCLPKEDGGLGFSWKLALFAVFCEGIIFIILSLVRVREAIFHAIPETLKSAISVGIGLYIALIGCINAKIVVKSDSTLITYQQFDSDFHTVGITALLAIIGVILMAILLVYKVKGGILVGMLIIWGVGMICEVTGLYVPDAAEGFYSLFPDFSSGIGFDGFKNIVGQAFQVDFKNVDILNFVIVLFALLFVDLFNTLGTFIGVASKADMMDENGNMKGMKGALLADAMATSVGAVFGASTTTTYVESAAGVTEGGRTGLTTIVTGFLFLISILLSPVFLAIPSFATAPALIIVGFYMIGNVVSIPFDDMIEGIPAFLAIIAMPFAYSIAEGIAVGVISYTILVTVSGKRKEKKLSSLMYILSVLFILKYILL